MNESKNLTLVFSIFLILSLLKVGIKVQGQEFDTNFYCKKPAVEKEFDFIGCIGKLYSDGTFTGNVTGSLIASNVVLTAKHADTTGFASDSIKIVFSIGSSKINPNQMYEVARFEAVPTKHYGFFTPPGYEDLGHDLAIVELDRPVENIAPVKLGKLTEADIGDTFIQIGYGYTDNLYWRPTEKNKQGINTNFIRNKTELTLMALSGLTYEHMYGCFEAFEKYYQWDFETGGWISRIPQPEFAKTAYLREIYYQNLLNPGNEAYLKGKAQPCEGDSGSPLLRKIDDQYKIYGVLLGVGYTKEKGCDLGAVFAIFGPEAFACLNQQMRYNK